jgi:hypothetical protein
MSLKSVKHQKPAPAGLSSPENGEAESPRRSGETPTAAKGNETVEAGTDSFP